MPSTARGAHGPRRSGTASPNTGKASSQTFGDYLHFHPHLHILISDGAFVGTHTFYALHRTDWEQVTELLRAGYLNSL